jgi:hypothetical protein
MARLDAQRNFPRRHDQGLYRPRCSRFTPRVSPLRRPVLLEEQRRPWPNPEHCSTIEWWWRL